MQTPFIRVPITSNLRSAAAAEKYIAKLCRDNPEAIRNTITLLNNIDAYLKDIKPLFNDITPSNIPLEEHSNFLLAEKKKEEMLLIIDAAIKNPHIGKIEFYLKDGVKENFVRNYKQAKERFIKAIKPLDDILADAEQRTNNINTNSQTPVKDVVNRQEGRW